MKSEEATKGCSFTESSMEESVSLIIQGIQSRVEESKTSLNEWEGKHNSFGARDVSQQLLTMCGARVNERKERSSNPAQDLVP